MLAAGPLRAHRGRRPGRRGPRPQGARPPARPRRRPQDPHRRRPGRPRAAAARGPDCCSASPRTRTCPLVREDFFDGDQYVIAMDWIEGTDLAKLLRARGRPGLAPSIVLPLAGRRGRRAHPPPHPGPAASSTATSSRPTSSSPRAGGWCSSTSACRRLPTPSRRRGGTRRLRRARAGRRASRPRGRATCTRWPPPPSRCSPASRRPGSGPPWEGIDPDAGRRSSRTPSGLGLATDPARRPATPGELVERLRAGWGSSLPTGRADVLPHRHRGLDRAVGGAPGRHGPGARRATTTLVAEVDGAPRRPLPASRWARATPPSRCSRPPRTRWRPRSTCSGRLAEEPGPAERRASRSGCGSRCTPARPSGAAATTSGPRSTWRPAPRAWPTAARSSCPAPRRPRSSTARCRPTRRSSTSGRTASGACSTRSQVFALSAPGRADARRRPPSCPYPGLLAFERGRRRALLRSRGGGGRARRAPAVARRFVAVVGASGSGKSSVLRAGVLAAVGRAATVITPGPAPVPLAEGRDLVVVDQFEELFTLCDDADRADPRSSTRCVDPAGSGGGRACGPTSTARCAEHAGLARARGRAPGAARPDERRRAAAGHHRAGRGGRAAASSPALVDVLVGEVGGEPGALPLLSHALRATWERRDGRTLTLEAYRDDRRGAGRHRHDRRGGVRRARPGRPGSWPGACSSP